VKPQSAIALFALSALPLPAMAQEAAPPPKLIVAISVDQFSTDIFNEHRTRWSSGLKRLTTGVVFPNGYQSHAATETCPGHATILTGAHPARAGIPANDWLNPRKPRVGKDGKTSYDVYCAEDESIPGTTASDYVVSPVHLKVPTLGDRMKQATPATRVVAVSGKDRGAVMMGGHKADLTLWWDGKAFATYRDSKAVLPLALSAINARARAAIEKPVAPKLPPACVPLSRPVPISKEATVGTLQPRKAGDARGWRATPEFDALTADLALAVFNDMKLGRGAGTDVLAIGLSATDYVGHTFGTKGAEMCRNLVGLDATLGRLFSALDRSRVPYSVVLTADHGGHDLPERNLQDALPAAQRVDPGLLPKNAGAALASHFKFAEPALLGSAPFGDIYLSASISQEKRKEVLDLAVALYRGHPQVEAVFTWADIMAAPLPSKTVDEWTLLDRVKSSFDPERSGDFYVILKPYVTPIPDAGMGYVATHGSVWGYDRRVPILFWWKGMKGFEQPNAVETVDILPTLASLVGLAVPADQIDGRCLDLVAGLPDNCR
jgi:predicted AlkP superfamily pyrophosphatase or phosphodiesterase